MLVYQRNIFHLQYRFRRRRVPGQREVPLKHPYFLHRFLLLKIEDHFGGPHSKSNLVDISVYRSLMYLWVGPCTPLGGLSLSIQLLHFDLPRIPMYRGRPLGCVRGLRDCKTTHGKIIGVRLIGPHVSLTSRRGRKYPKSAKSDSAQVRSASYEFNLHLLRHSPIC